MVDSYEPIHPILFNAILIEGLTVLFFSLGGSCVRTPRIALIIPFSILSAEVPKEESNLLSHRKNRLSPTDESMNLLSHCKNRLSPADELMNLLSHRKNRLSPSDELIQPVPHQLMIWPLEKPFIFRVLRSYASVWLAKQTGPEAQGHSART